MKGQGQGQERHGKGSDTSSRCEMKSDPLPRTSRDAGPYRARMVFAGGWGLAVSGWMMRQQVRSIQHSMQHSVLCTPSLR